VPDHQELAEGTLASILRQSKLSRQELARLL
jgi:predicted RNA binding protein YcfA (HicA-like mRNA interferase family)